MKLIVVSSERGGAEERDKLRRLFDAGLALFHLRKPDWTVEQFEEYLDFFSNEERNKMIAHSHFELATKYKLGGVHFTEKERSRCLKNRRRLAPFKKHLTNWEVSSAFHYPE